MQRRKPHIYFWVQLRGHAKPQMSTAGVGEGSLPRLPSSNSAAQLLWGSTGRGEAPQSCCPSHWKQRSSIPAFTCACGLNRSEGCGDLFPGYLALQVWFTSDSWKGDPSPLIVGSGQAASPATKLFLDAVIFALLTSSSEKQTSDKEAQNKKPIKQELPNSRAYHTMAKHCAP